MCFDLYMIPWHQAAFWRSCVTLDSGSGSDSGLRDDHDDDDMKSKLPAPSKRRKSCACHTSAGMPVRCGAVWLCGADGT